MLFHAVSESDARSVLVRNVVVTSRFARGLREWAGEELHVCEFFAGVDVQDTAFVRENGLFNVAGDMSLNINVSSSTITPEKNLLAAILRRALFDYVNGAADEKTSAEEWFFADEDGGALFTFDFVCSHLGFDAGSIRGRLKHVPKIWQKSVLAA